jgi:hypothetical protein
MVNEQAKELGQEEQPLVQELPQEELDEVDPATEESLPE